LAKINSLDQVFIVIRHQCRLPLNSSDQFTLDNISKCGIFVLQQLQKHKQKGESIVVWGDGRIVEIPPGQIGMYQKPLEK
jgi:hypothetical protein